MNIWIIVLAVILAVIGQWSFCRIALSLENKGGSYLGFESVVGLYFPALGATIIYGLFAYGFGCSAMTALIVVGAGVFLAMIPPFTAILLAPFLPITLRYVRLKTEQKKDNGDSGEPKTALA